METNLEHFQRLNPDAPYKKDWFIYKTKTNGGDTAKFYVNYLRNADMDAVSIRKLVLSKTSPNKKERILKVYKGLYLCEEILSIKSRTLGMFAATIFSMKKEDANPYREPNEL